MSVRLTKEIRKAITSKILKYTFDARFADLSTEESAIAEAVYADLYSNTVLSQMKAMPSGFLPTNNELRIRFTNLHTYLKLKENRLMADKHYKNWITYGADHPLTERWLQFENTKKSLNSERDNLSSHIRAVLASVTTIKKLIEIWPEIKEFAEPFEKEPIVTAVSFPIQELNTRLGLSLKTAS